MTPVLVLMVGLATLMELLSLVTARQVTVVPDVNSQVNKTWTLLNTAYEAYSAPHLFIVLPCVHVGTI